MEDAKPIHRGGGSPPIRHCNSRGPEGTYCDCRLGHEPPHESFGGYTWTEAEALKPVKPVSWKKRLAVVTWIAFGIFIWNCILYFTTWLQSWRMHP